MPEKSYYVDFIFDEFPVLATGTNPETGETMTFEDAKAEIIDWLERELEAAKQMQEEEHQLYEETDREPDQGQERQWWEDNVS